MEVQKTRLQAFEEAQKTGQIAITEETAKLFANILKMEGLLNDTITLLAAPYDDTVVESDITKRLLDAWQPFCDVYAKEVSDYITSNSLSLLDFKGL